MATNKTTAPNFMRPASDPVMIAAVIMANAAWNATSTNTGYASWLSAPSASPTISPTRPASPSWSNPPKNGREPSPPYANDHPAITHVTPTMPSTANDMIIVLTTFLRRDKPP